MTEQTTRGSAYYSNSSHKRAAMRATPLQVPASGATTGVRLLINTTPENATTLRGGSSWDDARGCRSASRNSYDPGNRFRNLGFRLAIYS